MRASLFGLAVLFAAAAPASAQVASRAPEWARPLLVTEPDAVNVRQSALAAPAGGIAVRLSIAPAQGGVARLVRFDTSPEGARLALRRFTGHNRNGWVLWGAEQLAPAPLDAARRAQLERLARAALAAGALGGESAAAAETACASGDFAWVEISDANRTMTFERRCAMDGAAGLLIRALSDAAGNKDEEEVFQAGLAEVLTADRAYAQAVRAEGLAAAAAIWAAEDGREFPQGGPVLSGRDAIAAHYAASPPADLLQWTPAGADVSARGDMATSWGEWSRTRTDAAPLTGSYLAVWRRDAEGAWRVAARLLN